MEPDRQTEATTRQIVFPPPLRVGIAGAGALGRRFARALSACHSTSVAAVADPALEQARRFAADWHCPYWASAAAMVEKQELDAVLVCGPQVGANEVVDWLDRGCSVAWEGAPAIDPEGVRQAVATAGRRRAVFLYGATLCYSAELYRARRLARTGVLGGLTAVDLTLGAPPREDPWETQPAGEVLRWLGVPAIGLVQHLLGAIDQVHATAGHNAAGRRVTSLWLQSVSGVPARVSLYAGGIDAAPFHLGLLGTDGRVEVGAAQAVLHRVGHDGPVVFGGGYDPQAACRRLVANLAAAILHQEETVVSRWSPVATCVTADAACTSLELGATAAPAASSRVILSRVEPR